MPNISQAETAILPPLTAIFPGSEARGILVSFNPRAGSRSCRNRAEAIGHVLSHAGYRVRLTTDLGELGAAASEGWKSGDLRAVLAVGGDGTASLVRRHVPLEIPMVPVPMGTENLLGRFVGQSTAPNAVLATIEDGVTVGLDLGSANGRHFLLMISAGFDAEVIRVLHENRQANINRTAYFLPTVQAIRSYAYPELQICCEPSDGKVPLCGRWVFGFNLPLYGLGLAISPDAVATDGQLDIHLFQRGNIWSVIRYLWHVKLGQHHGLTDVSMSRSHRFRIEGPAAPPVAYQIDGDYGGTLPVDVEVLPGALRLMVSREMARRLGFTLPADGK
jgi:diacylglycerol kinase family enzyme